MHQDQNSARLGSQRQLLQMVLGYSKLQPDGSDVSRPTLGMRTGSPSLQADDIQGPQGYTDVDAMGSQMFNPGAHQLRRAAEEAFAAHIEDRYVMLQAYENHSDWAESSSRGPSRSLAADQAFNRNSLTGAACRKHMPDRSNWGMIGANSGIGAAGLGPSSMVSSWARSARTPLDGSSAAGLLNQQVCTHGQDTCIGVFGTHNAFICNV